MACCLRHYRRPTRAWELALLLRLFYSPCIRSHKSYCTFGVKKHGRPFSSSFLWLAPPSKWTSSINPTSAATERSGPLERAQRGSSLGLEDCPFCSAKQQMSSRRAGNDASSPGSPSRGGQGKCQGRSFMVVGKPLSREQLCWGKRRDGETTVKLSLPSLGAS